MAGQRTSREDQSNIASFEGSRPFPRCRLLAFSSVQETASGGSPPGVRIFGAYPFHRRPARCVSSRSAAPSNRLEEFNITREPRVTSAALMISQGDAALDRFANLGRRRRGGGIVCQPFSSLIGSAFFCLIKCLADGEDIFRRPSHQPLDQRGIGACF